jgi:serine/threonine-protein kinase PknK
VTNGAKVLLADDDVLLREGLAGLLERSGYEVVGQCGTGTELLELAREHEPELVIVDIRMPPTHTSEGLDAARLIREELPQTGTGCQPWPGAGSFLPLLGLLLRPA